MLHGVPTAARARGEFESTSPFTALELCDVARGLRHSRPLSQPARAYRSDSSSSSTSAAAVRHSLAAKGRGCGARGEHLAVGRIPASPESSRLDMCAGDDQPERPPPTRASLRPPPAARLCRARSIFHKRRHQLHANPCSSPAPTLPPSQSLHLTPSPTAFHDRACPPRKHRLRHQSRSPKSLGRRRWTARRYISLPNWSEHTRACASIEPRERLGSSNSTPRPRTISRTQLGPPRPLLSPSPDYT